MSTPATRNLQKNAGKYFEQSLHHLENDCFRDVVRITGSVQAETGGNCRQERRISVQVHLERVINGSKRITNTSERLDHYGRYSGSAP